MNHLDVDWSEPSFREKFRLPFFILIVLFVMVISGSDLYWFGWNSQDAQDSKMILSKEH